MSEACKFWLEWGGELLVAIGTISAVIIALFGERIKARLFPPNLQLTLDEPGGVKTPINLHWVDETGKPMQRTAPGRYYHLNVRNAARWPAATQVQVCIVRLEERGPDGEFGITWTGELPLQWSLQEIQPLTRVVGRAATCDLCNVVKDKWFEFLPMVQTLRFRARRRKEDSDRERDVIVTVEARAAETTSKPLRLRVAWDGEWNDGDLEMQRHFTLRVLPPSKPDPG